MGIVSTFSVDGRGFFLCDRSAVDSLWEVVLRDTCIARESIEMNMHTVFSVPEIDRGEAIERTNH